MYKSLLLIILINVFSLQHTLADPKITEERKPIYSLVESEVKFKAVMDLPTNQPDSKIAYGKNELQFGYLWLPEQKLHKNLIVLVHGGCWLNAFGVDHSFPMATALSQAGHPVWSLEYRRTGDVGGGWPGSYEDIKLALMSLSKLKANGVERINVSLENLTETFLKLTRRAAFRLCHARHRCSSGCRAKS